MSRRQRMNGSIAWMTKNSVSANLLMFGIVIGGFAMVFFSQIKKEVFPQIEPDRVGVSVAYPGASPAEVERGIVLALEEAVKTVDGIKEISATAGEGLGTISMELELGVDKAKVLSDVKNAVDRIITFPKNVERPMVRIPKMRAQAISIVIFGDQDEKVLRELAEQTRDELLALPDISSAEIGGVRPIEISIEVSKENLRNYGLTLSAIANRIRSTAMEMPAGGVKTKGGEVLLRTTERRDLGMEYQDIPILTNRDGSPVRLRDIAEIKDSFAETDVSASVEGKRSVRINIYSVGDESPPDVAAAAKEYVKVLKKNLPPGVDVAVWGDYADMYRQRLDLLLRNAAIGLVLVFVILGLFLEPRLAFWVTMGIPISFMGGLLFLPAFGVSINMVSLFAFIVTLGMVVDDAIIVGENVFRLRRQGVPPIEAAIEGAREIAMPVFFSVVTTIAAFAPLLFIPGVAGKYMFAIPMVVILVLTVSLIESFLILPAHLGHLGKPNILAFIIRHQQKFSRGVERFVELYYAPLLRLALRQRHITLAIAIAILITMLGLVEGGIIKLTMWPKEESDRIEVVAKMPFGVPIEETEKVMKRIVGAAHDVIEENGGKKISKGIFSLLGATRGGRLASVVGSHLTQITVNLVPTNERSIGSADFATEWREKIGDISGLESITFDASTGSSSPGIDIALGHRSLDVLDSAAKELARDLASFKGVKDIDDGVASGKPQIDFTLSEAGISAGFTSMDIAAQMRASFYGVEALRQQRDRNEVRVMVRLPRSERESLGSVEDLMIRTPSGGEMPLRLAADIHHGRAHTYISRNNGKRTARVKAFVDEDIGNTQEILSAVFSKKLPALRDRYSGLSFEPAGRQKSNQEFIDFLIFAFLLSLAAIYILIAIPLYSYSQPIFVVMSAIPFGMIGAALGHLIMGISMSIISFMGVVALTGVVVNDSLVLVASANRFRGQGLDRFAAAEAAGKQRFRAVILTSLTTFGGLTPMIFENSMQARILIPMAVSLGFGVLFSTMITLVLVPSLFMMIERPREWFRARKAASLEMPERGSVSTGETV